MTTVLDGALIAVALAIWAFIANLLFYVIRHT